MRHVLVNGTPIRLDGAQLDSTEAAARHATGDRLNTPSAQVGSAHGSEEGPQVVDEQLGLLHRGEVTAARHDRPVRHVVALLDPRRAGSAAPLPSGSARRRSGTLTNSGASCNAPLCMVSQYSRADDVIVCVTQ